MTASEAEFRKQQSQRNINAGCVMRNIDITQIYPEISDSHNQLVKQLVGRYVRLRCHISCCSELRKHCFSKYAKRQKPSEATRRYLKSKVISF